MREAPQHADVRLWRGLLSAGRPVWQLSILLYYTAITTAPWQSAVIAVAGATVLASNIVLSWPLRNGRGSQMRHVVATCESAILLPAAGILAFTDPLGPACLLLLPSLFTLSTTSVRDPFALVIAYAPLLFVSFALGSDLLGPLRGHPLFSAWLVHLEEDGTSLTQQSLLLLATYTGIILSGSFLAFVLQGDSVHQEQLKESQRRADAQAIELHQLYAKLESYVGQVHLLATAQERNRVAGEIHDTTAHRLTALVVQLQAARRHVQDVVSGGTDSIDVDAATANLDVCEALAREALDAIRHSVRAVRSPDSGRGVAAIKRMTQDFAAVTGMIIDWSAADDLPPLSAQLFSILYKIVEESLTNAQRHGLATRAQIALRQCNGRLEVQIDDNGVGTSSLAYGFGLHTMQQRLAQVGGAMQVTSAAGQGFSLRATMALWEVEMA